jgi:hypothetical protein
MKNSSDATVAVETLVKKPKHSEAQLQAWIKYYRKKKETPEYNENAKKYNQKYRETNRAHYNALARKNYQLRKQKKTNEPLDTCG